MSTRDERRKHLGYERHPVTLRERMFGDTFNYRQKFHGYMMNADMTVMFTLARGFFAMFSSIMIGTIILFVNSGTEWPTGIDRASTIFAVLVVVSMAFNLTDGDMTCVLTDLALHWLTAPGHKRNRFGSLLVAFVNLVGDFVGAIIALYLVWWYRGSNSNLLNQPDTSYTPAQSSAGQYLPGDPSNAWFILYGMSVILRGIVHDVTTWRNENKYWNSLEFVRMEPVTALYEALSYFAGQYLCNASIGGNANSFALLVAFPLLTNDTNNLGYITLAYFISLLISIIISVGFKWISKWYHWKTVTKMQGEPSTEDGVINEGEADDGDVEEDEVPEPEPYRGRAYRLGA